MVGGCGKLFVQVDRLPVPVSQGGGPVYLCGRLVVLIDRTYEIGKFVHPCGEHFIDIVAPETPRSARTSPAEKKRRKIKHTRMHSEGGVLCSIRSNRIWSRSVAGVGISVAANVVGA